MEALPPSQISLTGVNLTITRQDRDDAVRWVGAGSALVPVSSSLILFSSGPAFITKLKFLSP